MLRTHVDGIIIQLIYPVSAGGSVHPPPPQKKTLSYLHLPTAKYPPHSLYIYRDKCLDMIYITKLTRANSIVKYKEGALRYRLPKDA